MVDKAAGRVDKNTALLEHFVAVDIEIATIETVAVAFDFASDLAAAHNRSNLNQNRDNNMQPMDCFVDRTNRNRLRHIVGASCMAESFAVAGLYNDCYDNYYCDNLVDYCDNFDSNSISYHRHYCC